ncbi:MAG: hypothetical protein QXP94_00360 [Thermofilaceae archaeon]
MVERRGSTGVTIYDELLRLLRDVLRESPETYELAEKLVKAYRDQGPRGIREEIRKLVAEVLNGATEA